MHNKKFSQETQDFMYELFLTAIERAISNGTYNHSQTDDIINTEHEEKIQVDTLDSEIPVVQELPHIMSLKQAAYWLAISEGTLKQRIYAKQIKAYKDGGYWKIKREWLEEYQNALIEKMK